MNKFKLSILLMTMLTGNAFAAESASANFQAGATLNSSCVFNITNISFGTVTPAATGEATATGTIDIICNKGVMYEIHMNGGNSSDITNRFMQGTFGNTDTLKYNIYTFAMSSVPWGNGFDGTAAAAGTGLGSQHTFGIYGKIPLNQYIKPDTYKDTITVTVNY